jgi:hypothetical protein
MAIGSWERVDPLARPKADKTPISCVNRLFGGLDIGVDRESGLGEGARERVGWRALQRAGVREGSMGCSACRSSSAAKRARAASWRRGCPLAALMARKVSTSRSRREK